MGKFLRRAFEWAEHIHTLSWIVQSIPWIFAKIGLWPMIAITVVTMPAAFMAYIRSWPEWVFVLFLVLFCWGTFFIILIIGYLKSKKVNRRASATGLQKQASIPSWYSYTEDMIFSILWQWKYFPNQSNDNSVDPSIVEPYLIPLCPLCKRELEAKPLGAHRNIYMKCPNCDFISKKAFKSYYEFKQGVLNESRGRIRNEEYKNKLKQDN